jgi:hypothetical protein
MTNSLQSSGSTAPEPASDQPAGWLKVGAVAAASAVAGGLLAAWWYRKTLQKLREAEEDDQNPHFGIHNEEIVDEV